MNIRIIVVTFGLVIVVAIALCLWQVVFGYSHLPVIELKSAVNIETDPCIGRERCLIVYYEPTMDDSNVASLVRDLRERITQSMPKVGLKIIVGGQKIERVKDLARSIGGQVFLDSDGIFARSTGIKGFIISFLPAWFVIDSNQAIIAKGSGLPGCTGPSKPIFDNFVRKYLKLADYL